MQTVVWSLVEMTDDLPAIEIPADSDLTGLEVREALKHWREHRPRMYAELEAAGTLVETAIAACEATADEEYDLHMKLIEQGHLSPVAFEIAREMVRERYVFLPTEEDVPDLMRLDSGLYSFQPDTPESEFVEPDPP
jgi:hypothetical protein